MAIALGILAKTWHDDQVSRGTQQLILGVKSIPEANMRSIALVAKLEASCPQEAFALLNELIALGGRGNLDVSLALAALVQCLEPPSKLNYQTRADLYAIANENAVPEIAYILLEGDREELRDTDDVPRAMVPGGAACSLGVRKSAARSQDRQLLSHLIADPNLQVVEILIGNPSLLEADVLVMASKRPADPEALRLIARHPKWSPSRRIRNALVLNPACPLSLACRLCLDLRDSDLREVTRNAASLPLLRGHADRLIQKRRNHAAAKFGME